jgi:hypothetical protein
MSAKIKVSRLDGKNILPFRPAQYVTSNELDVTVIQVGYFLLGQGVNNT